MNGYEEYLKLYLSLIPTQSVLDVSPLAVSDALVLRRRVRAENPDHGGDDSRQDPIEAEDARPAGSRGCDEAADGEAKDGAKHRAWKDTFVLSPLTNECQPSSSS